jgi:triosephosphate isomerase
MVKEFCQYVIIGHSERRAYFAIPTKRQKENQSRLRYRLDPDVCVGETLAEYEAGKTGAVVERQVKEG